MRSVSVKVCVAAMATGLVLGAAGPASASQSPNENASCLGTVFQAQAVDEPRTVSNRIHEIRELYLDGTPFGQALKPLAQSRCP